MGRKLERRQRKKARQRGEMIPALHAGGSVIHQLTGHGNIFGETAGPGDPLGTGGGGPPEPPPPLSGDAGLRAAGWVEIRPGIWFNPGNGDTIDLRPSALAPSGGGGGSGAATPQFRPGELAFMREQFEFEQEAFQLDLELRRLQEERRNAIAEGNLELARRTEARIDRIQTQQLELDRRRLRLEASLGRAQGIAGLASSRGDIEARRAEFLSNLAANPRDFVQLDIAQGGGQSVIGQLLNQQPVTGRSSALIGDTPTLGQDFQRLIQAVTARPDVPLFDEAADLFRDVPQFAKGGTQVVTDEPIIGIGAISGRPRFTLGEPAPGFPQGKPEKLEVTPLQHGGSVNTSPFKTGQSRPAFARPFQAGQTGRAASAFGSPFQAGAGGGQNAFLAAIGGSPQVQAILNNLNQPSAPAPPSGQFAFPDFPGFQQLMRFLNLGSGFGDVEQARAQFGQGGSDAFDIARAIQEFESLPQTPGEAIRRLMSGLNPQAFHGLLPSDVGVLESVVSALGVPPEDFITSLLRSFPTGPDPSRISFGNFADGGTIIAGVGARPVAA